MGNRTKRKPAPCEWECGHLLSSCKQGKQQKVGADHLMRILGEGKKPTVFPGQAGWWQCTEVVQDEAWFLDTGNSSPSCAMRISPLLGRVTEAPASGCWHSILCHCAHSEELCDPSKGVTRAPLCCWHRLQGGNRGMHVCKGAWVLKLEFREEQRLSCYVKKGWTCV